MTLLLVHVVVAGAQKAKPEETPGLTGAAEDVGAEALRHEIAALRASHAMELAALNAALQHALRAQWVAEEAQRAASLAVATQIPSPRPSIHTVGVTRIALASEQRGGTDTAQGAAPKRPRGGARHLHQQTADMATEKSCSQTELSSVLRVATSSEQLQSVVLSLMETNVLCGLCIVQCASEPLPDAVRCVFACGHERENRCDEETGVLRIGPLIRRATLHDRASITSMLEPVERDCAYCVLATVEFVCGRGCVLENLHIFTDFPIVPQPCLRRPSRLRKQT